MRSRFIDLAAYVMATIPSATRREDSDLFVFDCPLCSDAYSHRRRGWLSPRWWSVGCFNAGCVADPRLAGGALEWVRRRERLADRGEAWVWLRTTYPGDPDALEDDRAPIRPLPETPFCRMPPAIPLHADSIVAAEARRFVLRQWGLTAATADAWGLRAVTTGRYAWRVLIPIQRHGEPVAFQGRSFRGGVPKYLSSREGPASDPQAESGWPTSACLFNLDAVTPGDAVVLVEGAGDVMRREVDRPPGEPTIGLLGTALTLRRVVALATAQPGSVTVALDEEPATRGLVLALRLALEGWSIPVHIGRWVGGKDAGSGATLVREPMPHAESLTEWVRWRLDAVR